MRQGVHLPIVVPASRKDGGNLCRVNPVEQYHDNKHKKCIKQVEIELMAQKISVEALEIFDGTEDRADHDQETPEIQGHHVLPPRDAAVGATGGCCVDGTMESHSNTDKEPKEDELDEETDDDDLSAGVQSLQAAGCLITTA